MFKNIIVNTLASCLGALFVLGCNQAESRDAKSDALLILALGQPAHFHTFDEFRAATYREPGEDGAYIVDGDIPIQTESDLMTFYQTYVSPRAQGRHAADELIVGRSNGADQVWKPSEKRAITYCVSADFGARRAAVVKAMTAAAGAWEKAADVNFIYKSGETGACNASNRNVVFDVRPVHGAS